MNTATVKITNKAKYRKLAASIFFDAIGTLSYLVPALGESIDFVWAPLSAILLFRMYRGAEGKIGGMINFFEEAFPFTDIIPTFTLTWIYKYMIKKGA